MDAHGVSRSGRRWGYCSAALERKAAFGALVAMGTFHSPLARAIHSDGWRIDAGRRWATRAAEHRAKAAQYGWRLP